jgi:hypothetical protein
MAPTLYVTGETTLTADRHAAVVPATHSLLDRPKKEPHTGDHISAVVPEPALPSLQPPAQRMAKRPSAVPKEKAPEEEVRLETPSPSSARTSSMLAQRQPPLLVEKASERESVLEVPSPSVKRTQRQPPLLVEKASEREGVLEVPSSSVTQTSSKRTPGVSLHISPAIEHDNDTTSPGRSQTSSAEIQLASVRSIKPRNSVASETTRSAGTVLNNPQRPALVSEAEQSTGVILRPISQQEQPTTVTSTRSKRSGDVTHQELEEITKTPIRPAQITLVPQAQERSATSPAQQARQQTPQGTTIHIGTIEVQIVPPSAPPMPLPASRPAPTRTRSTSALSRELTSFIGLRQG